LIKYLKTILFAINPKNRKNLSEQQREIALYVIFGVLTTVISFVSYFLFRLILPESVISATALPVAFSWICAVTFAYITNKIWVFKSKQENISGVIREFFGFYVARLFTLSVDLAAMFLLVDLAGLKGGWHELLARVLVSVAVLVLNYILSKVFIFKK